MNKYSKRKLKLRSKEQGGIVVIILICLSVLATVTYLGSTIFSSIMLTNQRITNVTQTLQTLTQAGYIVATETTRNASGIPVAVAYSTTGNPLPSGGGVIPTSSAAPKQDQYGVNIGYCTNAASAQSDPVFALISAGTDKTFNTTCTQALAGTTVGDDKIIVKSVANILQGVGGTVYYGDPVPTTADLGNLASVRPGQLRVVLSDGSVWTNPTGNSGLNNWVRISISSTGVTVVPIANIGDSCTQGTSVSAVEEGTAMTSDRKSILTCQNNKWTVSNRTQAVLNMRGPDGTVPSCPANWNEINYQAVSYNNNSGVMAFERSCMSQNSCQAMTLQGHGYANTCPAGWTQGSYDNGGSDAAGDVKYRTCYRCDS